MVMDDLSVDFTASPSTPDNQFISNLTRWPPWTGGSKPQSQTILFNQLGNSVHALAEGIYIFSLYMPCNSGP